MDTSDRAEWAQRYAEHPGADWRVQARRGDEWIQHGNEGVFDELVVDHWLHLEQLDERTWWMRVGDARIQVSVARDGAVSVDVQRGFYDVVRGATVTGKSAS